MPIKETLLNVVNHYKRGHEALRKGGEFIAQATKPYRKVIGQFCPEAAAVLNVADVALEFNPRKPVESSLKFVSATCGESGFPKTQDYLSKMAQMSPV